jgi:hypothetical protein
MNRVGWKCLWSVVATTTTCLAFALSLNAQVETKTTTTTGKPTVVTSVERGEVLTVSGNDLIIRMSDGSMRNIENVPDSARVTVDGKKLGIRDLKPGMKLQRTITTTSTPMTVTTVQSVKGKVWFINAPASVILTMEDGKNQQFKIPKGQQFNVDGKMVDAFELRKGMIITATKIVEVPTVAVTKTRTVTGEAPPAVAAEPQPAPPPADAPVLVAEGDEVPIPASEAAAAPEATPPAAAPEATPPAAAPKAASSSPTAWLIGLLVLLALIGVIWWVVSRKKSSNP